MVLAVMGIAIVSMAINSSRITKVTYHHILSIAVSSEAWAKLCNWAMRPVRAGCYVLSGSIVLPSLETAVQKYNISLIFIDLPSNVPVSIPFQFQQKWKGALGAPLGT